jgi:hypothetical protein
LKELASITGLTYVHLDPNGDLVAPLASAARPRRVTVASDIRSYPACGALALLVILYGLGAFGRGRLNPRVHA